MSGLSEASFLKWASEATAVHQLLHQLAFAACILFGVKPESPQLERRIVEWHWKQATVSFSVGEVCAVLHCSVCQSGRRRQELTNSQSPRRQTWNLVGAKWWQQWCVYSGMDIRNGTPSGPLPLPIIPDHPRVGVESIDPKSSAGSVATGNASHPRPGPIANWTLLMRSGSRRLKDKLVFSRDFYVRSLLSLWMNRALLKRKLENVR